MTQKCTICYHPARDEIDRALVSRAETCRGLAAKHGVSTSALVRHSDDHIPAALAKAKDAEDVTRAGKLLAHVEDLRTRAIGILDDALATGGTEENPILPDRRVALAAIREARGCLELLGKLAGQLPEGATVNIILTPEWQTIQTVILHALDDYPEARLAVADALASPRLESFHAPGHA